MRDTARDTARNTERNSAGRLVTLVFMLVASCWITSAKAEDGYELWLRYPQVADAKLLKNYRNQLTQIQVAGDSDTISATRRELQRGLGGLLGKPVALGAGKPGKHALVVGTPASSAIIASLGLAEDLAKLGREGYLLRQLNYQKRPITVIAANTDIGLLYGSFHLLRLIQTQQPLAGVNIASAPRLEQRVANHWDNVNRLVERGYAGLSLWDWGTLPNYRDPRYTDYARINASIGINGTVINNVNADPRLLTDQFLQKIKVLADIFRPYGIKLYLSINFNSPRAFGDLETADPLDPRVIAWWQAHTDKIYKYIPDFGGFLVKADSEGQPGPQGYGRNHADGANMLADVLAPHGGLVFWRAFVYHPDIGDRFRGAYDEFKPLDGKFRDNVILQVKNGPIDFQPREPFSPLFPAMPNTNLMLELQVTQEYFGFNTHLAYQGPLFEEILQTDTRVNGEGSTVGNILAGKTFPTAPGKKHHSGMAAVINPGNDRNWTGHPFVAASWYAFGRMAWNYQISAEQAADEWLRMTFSNDAQVVAAVKPMMMMSREAGVNYRDPLGLTHVPSQGDHYRPGPWTDNMGRADWNATYYHRADKNGIGFDRTATGSNALAQYPAAIAKQYGDVKTVPENLLLWFHHLPWTYQMKSGRSLWDELVDKYSEGVAQVQQMQTDWEKVQGKIDPERFAQVKALLEIQARDAQLWRDASITYFQSFSGMPIPQGYSKPEHDLDYYKHAAHRLYVPDPWHPAGNERVLD